MNEEFSEDLEEEINRVDDWYPVELKYIQAIAHHFAEWQKQKMMKDACDTKITTDKGSIFPIIKYQLPLTYNCKIGDKVKLIIIKED